MLYREGQILYYVNPCVFYIDLVKVDMAIKEPDRIYYIDSTGAYLAEDDLFEDLDEAKAWAMQYLDKFYVQMKHNIKTNKPKFEDTY